MAVDGSYEIIIPSYVTNCDMHADLIDYLRYSTGHASSNEINRTNLDALVK